MPVSWVTAMMIRSNSEENIRCTHAGPHQNGKYAGWIQLWKGGEYHTDLISTDARYDTGEEAVAAVQNVVDELRKEKIEIRG